MKTIVLCAVGMVCGVALAGCSVQCYFYDYTMLPIAVVGTLMGLVALILGGYHLYKTFSDYRVAADDLHQLVATTHTDPELLGLSQQELWRNVLKQLNVDVRTDDEHDNRFLFDFQGGHFYVDVDDTAFSELYYAFIEEADLSDVEEVSLMRRAINEANYHACPTIVYSTNEEEDKMYVHMVQSVFLMPQIPHAKDYLQSRLVVFFQLQRRLTNIEERMRQEA